MIELPLESVEGESEVESVKEPEIDQEGLRKELDAVGEIVCEGKVSSSTQGVTTEVAEEEELGGESFWALLLRAGYTIW